MQEESSDGQLPTLQEGRRRSLIDATISAISVHGFSSLTLQRITAQAGLTAGIVTFYFKNKEGLLLETLRAVAEEFERHIDQALGRAGTDPAERLRAVALASLSPEVTEPRKVAVWYAFIAEARARADYQVICGQRDRRFAQTLRSLCEGLIATAPASVSMDSLALGQALSGLIDAKWQEVLFAEQAPDVTAQQRSVDVFLASVFPWAYDMPARHDYNAGTVNRAESNVNEIVRADEQHLGEVARLFDLYRQFYEQAPDIDLAMKYIAARFDNGDSIIFVAIDEQGRGLGFTQLYPALCSVAAEPFFVLYDLFVDTSARKQGLGRALMERAREFAVQSGASRIDLETAVDNHNAQKLYESLGYQREQSFYKYSLELAH